MAHSVSTSSSHVLISPHLISNSILKPCHPKSPAVPSPAATASRAQCEATRSTVTPQLGTSTTTLTAKTKKKSSYEIENLTTWLLKQEQAGHIDAELTIVLSSISLACKQIGSLLQRSSIIQLTRAQGTINVQGEDQKKLDVVSNEVFCNCLRSSGRMGS